MNIVRELRMRKGIQQKELASYPECHRFESYLSHIQNHGESTLRGFLMPGRGRKK